MIEEGFMIEEGLMIEVGSRSRRKGSNSCGMAARIAIGGITGPRLNRRGKVRGVAGRWLVPEQDAAGVQVLSRAAAMVRTTA